MTAFQLTRSNPPTLTGKHPMPDLKDDVTTEEAAKALGFHIESVRRLRQALRLAFNATSGTRKSLQAHASAGSSGGGLLSPAGSGRADSSASNSR